jgi:hypothetical protein
MIVTTATAKAIHCDGCNNVQPYQTWDGVIADGHYCIPCADDLFGYTCAGCGSYSNNPRSVGTVDESGTFCGWCMD